MTVIGELAVNAVVRTEEVERGVRTFRAELGKMDGIAKGVGGTLVALGTTAAILGYRLVAAEGEIADAIATTAQKLDLGIERLSQYRYAASVTANMLDGALDAALVRMNTNVSLAEHGMGKAQSSLAELHLNAQKLAGVNTDQRLGLIAEALARVERSSDRIRLAEKIFGTGDMALVLERGRAGLEALALESDNVGATFDELANRKLAAADDALHRMGKSIDGAKHALGGLLAPAVTTVADGITDFVAGFRQLPGVISEADLKLRIHNRTVEDQAAVRKRVNDQIAAARRAEGLRAGAALQATNARENQELQQDIASLRSQVEAARSGNETFGMSELETAKFNRANHMVDRGLNDQLIKELETRHELEETRARGIAAQEREQQLQERAKGIIEANRTPLEMLKEDLAEIAALQNAGKLTEDQALRAAETARQGFRSGVASGGQRAPLGALKFGSSEAFRAIRESQNQDRNKVPEQQLKELQEGNKLAQQVIDQLEAMKTAGIADWS